MNVWLVVPAWRRLAVTRLALTEHVWLHDQLAAGGITANTVVVADDGNLDVARDLGLHTLEMDNRLGAKINAGFEYAADRGADWFMFCGSDNWLHPSVFDALAEQPERNPPVLCGSTGTVVDLIEPRLSNMNFPGRFGASLWLIPRWVLEKVCDFRPVEDERMRSMELAIRLGFGFRPAWRIYDPHPLLRVGFNSGSDMSPYDMLRRSFGFGQEITPPWDELANYYPRRLADLAQRTSELVNAGKGEQLKPARRRRKQSSRPSLCFVTPAYKRFDTSAVCFEQRAWAIEQLRQEGIDATCVIVADDDNLDLAREYGFATVERDNGEGLIGRKFNDGYQHAAAQGCDWVCPIGSDSWVDPGFIVDGIRDVDPQGRTICYSRHYAVVRPDGERRAQLLVSYEGGTTMFYPTEILQHCRYRPIPEDRTRGCDGATMDAIRKAGDPTFKIFERHPLETVSFQSDLQVTNYDALLERWGVGEETRPAFRGLRSHYPAALVRKAQALYAREAVAA